MKKYISLILTFICIISIFTLSGCKTADGSSEYPVIIGHTSISSKPSKIVILNDSIADIIMTGGYIEQIAARSDECTQEDLQIIESVGSKSNPDIEKIKSLGAQLVIADETLTEEAKDALKAAEIVVLPMIPAKTREELTSLYINISAVFMGNVTGKEKGSKKAENIFIAIDDMIRQIPDQSIPNTCCYIFDISSESCNIVTGDMFASKMIEYIKCINIASGATDGELSLDSLKMQNPKYIFCDTGVAEKLRNNPKTQNLDAIKNNNVFEIERTAFTRQGGTILNTVQFMITKIYPELLDDALSSYINTSSSDSDTQTGENTDIYTVSTDTGLNLRTEPVDGEILMTLDYGIKVTVIDSSDSEWFKVRLDDGTEGYCSSEFLTPVQ